MSKKTTMKLLKLEIRGLFDLFDYDIPLTNPENLTIITGPNGFGKTMILNIIDSLFNKNFYFFEKLLFKKIHFTFNQTHEIILLKKSITKEPFLEFAIYIDGELVESFLSPNEKRNDELFSLISRYLPQLRRLDDNIWQDRRNRKLFSIEEVLDQFSDELPKEVLNNQFIYLKNKKLNQIISTIDVHLIKEQRLLKRKQTPPTLPNSNTYFSDSIQEYAIELSQLIKQTINDSFKISQELDSSFPKRLLTELGQLTEIDFKSRFYKLKEKQEKLKSFGLTESLQEVPDSFISENAKVLLVYLNDSEKKTSVFDDLLERLELFTNILNNRRFTFKSIKIDKEKGFFFVTSKNTPLNLTELSSGEQHEVILLYELIFKAKANTLVLIDEPEISLHVSWQKEFLNDLIKIIDLQKIQVIIATHSPQIINNRWDLTVDLEKVEE